MSLITRGLGYQTGTSDPGIGGYAGVPYGAEIARPSIQVSRVKTTVREIVVPEVDILQLKTKTDILKKPEIILNEINSKTNVITKKKNKIVFEVENIFMD